MQSRIRRLARIVLAAVGLLMLGGCYYYPAPYYTHPGVVYDDGHPNNYDNNPYNDTYGGYGGYGYPGYYAPYYAGYPYYGYGYPYYWGWPFGFSIGYSYYGGHYHGGHGGHYGGGGHHH